jgi:hypothetical protein
MTSTASADYLLHNSDKSQLVASTDDENHIAILRKLCAQQLTTIIAEIRKYDKYSVEVRKRVNVTLTLNRNTFNEMLFRYITEVYNFLGPLQVFDKKTNGEFRKIFLTQDLAGVKQVVSRFFIPDIVKGFGEYVSVVISQNNTSQETVQLERYQKTKIDEKDKTDAMIAGQTSSAMSSTSSQSSTQQQSSATPSTIAVFLDSRYRNLVESTAQEYVWDVTTTQNNAIGYVTLSTEAKNITSVKFNSGSFPAFQDNALRQYSRFSISIRELAQQGYYTQESTRFLLFQPYREIRDRAEFNLTSSEGIITFPKLITSLNRISISFGNPTQLISIPDDYAFATVNAANPCTITFSSAHGLTSGDLIYITTFTTTAPETDATVITNVTRRAGHTVERTSDTIVTIADLDTSSVVVVGSSRIYIAKNRVFLDISLMTSAT